MHRKPSHWSHPPQGNALPCKPPYYSLCMDSRIKQLLVDYRIYDAWSLCEQSKNLYGCILHTRTNQLLLVTENFKHFSKILQSGNFTTSYSVSYHSKHCVKCTKKLCMLQAEKRQLSALLNMNLTLDYNTVPYLRNNFQLLSLLISLLSKCHLESDYKI